MEKIKVSKQRLIDSIIENRVKHSNEFSEAHYNWKVKVREAFAKKMQEIEEDNWEDLNCTAYLPKPQHHLKDYDLALQMLDFSVDDEIEIEQHEFNQYVMDDWAWKAGFALTNSSYLG